MKRSIAIILVAAIILITFSSRLLISLQTEEFSYDAYFGLRQVENIQEHGLPLFEDPLSYGGRSHLFPPLFFYLIAAFSFLGSTLAAKIVPNLFSSLIAIPIYLIAFRFTKNRSISVMAAFFSAFIPIFFARINDISSYSFVVPLMFFFLYSLMRLNEKRHIYLSLFFLVLLVLAHASVFIIILSLLLYMMLVKIESMPVQNKKQEMILFASFLALWFYFIVYKKAFIIHGSLVIWQNIPLEILTNYFYDLNLIQSIYYIGLVPVILGIFGVYAVLFKAKKKNVLLVVAIFLTVLLLLWLKLLPFRAGLVFLGIAAVLLSSYTVKLAYSYLKKTKIPNLANWFLAGLALIFLLTSVIPSFNLALNNMNTVPTSEEVTALNWLKNNTPENSTILARVEEGQMINYFTHRKTVIDDHFLMISDAQQRYEDVQEMFSLRLQTEVLRRMTNYGVDYIYFSGKFGPEEKLYYAEDNCFKLKYNETVKIYEVECTIK